MKQRIIYKNGKFCTEEAAHISIFSGFAMYGLCTFEMTRSFNKDHFQLYEHLERLYNGIKILQIPVKESIEKLMAICLKVSKLNENAFNKDDEHRLMINIGTGNLSIYPGSHDPIVLVSDFPLSWTVRGMGKLFDTGINAVVTRQQAIPSYLIDQRIKNRNRLNLYMANLETANYKGDNNWALLTDDKGFITEGTGANIFCVKDGVWRTPKGHNILRGITRQYIIDILKMWKGSNELIIDILEDDISMYDLITADEALFCATPFVILPITKANGYKIGDGNRGNHFNWLLKVINAYVGVDIEQQIKDWNKKDKGKITASPYQIKK